MNDRIRVFVAFLTLLAANSGWAHHNMTALYDLNDPVTLKGVFMKMDWRNPHIQLIVETKSEAGNVETWAVEGPPPSFFRTRDIAKADFEGALGKMVTLEASRARDHSKSGLLRVLTLPDGKVISACPQNC